MDIMIVLRLIVVFGYTNTLYTVDATREFDEIVRGIRKTLTLDHGRNLVRGPEDVVTTFIDVSLDKCIWECYARHRCGAAEYKPVSKYCKLYRNKPGVQTEDTRAPGTIAIHGFADKISRKCGENVCNGKEACRYRNEIFSCGIEECANPMDKSIKGNIYSVGGKYRTRCSNDRVPSLKCVDTGQWWTLVGNQSALMCNDRTDSSARVFTNRLGITLRCLNGWMVFQRRRSGYEDFQRDWDDYKYGFGDVCGAYWMGLENMYTIMNTSGQRFEMSITLKVKPDVPKKNIRYHEFMISNEADLYRLTLVYYRRNSTAGDSLSALSGNAFSTFDRDNDGNSDINCAEEFHGAWWFGGCDQPLQSHLNGRYSADGEEKVGHGVVWNSLSDANNKITFVRMRFREYSGR